jgi:hypothetical protein
MSNILRSTGGALVLVLCEWPRFYFCHYIACSAASVVASTPLKAESAE